MTTPENYMYSKTHEWVNFLDDETAVTGFTDYAQEALSDLVFINPPEVDDNVTAGEPYGDIESVKAVAPIYSHVAGTIVAVNEEVADDPKKINDDPYGSWIIKIGDVAETGELMDADAYDKFCEEEEH